MDYQADEAMKAARVAVLALATTTDVFLAPRKAVPTETLWTELRAETYDRDAELSTLETDKPVFVLRVSTFATTWMAACAEQKLLFEGLTADTNPLSLTGYAIGRARLMPPGEIDLPKDPRPEAPVRHGRMFRIRFTFSPA